MLVSVCVVIADAGLWRSSRASYVTDGRLTVKVTAQQPRLTRPWSLVPPTTDTCECSMTDALIAVYFYP